MSEICIQISDTLNGGIVSEAAERTNREQGTESVSRRGQQPVANSVPNTQPIPTGNCNSLRRNALSVLTLTTSSRPVGHVEQANRPIRLRNQHVGAAHCGSNPKQA
jgi:hypothetical protein